MHIFLSALTFFGLCGLSLAKNISNEENHQFFESKIRPILIENCYECHSSSAEKLKANLFLDSRDGWSTGGDSGPAIVPHEPDQSLLIEAISHTNSDLQMPPNERLEDHEIANLRKWISMGAPDPRIGKPKKKDFEINLEEGRKFWSFNPPVNHPIPQIENSEWPAGDIDKFILAKIEAEGLTLADDAPKRDLIRRIYYDLIGLPPTPNEVADFLADDSPKAFEKIVDRLLQQPEFGERWGRHWLDVARFAESSGGGRSLIFPDAWRFRDYVIKSLNDDKPYDQFVREQIAGDILPSQSSTERNEQLTGSGYLVLGAMNYELQDQETLEMEFVDEQINAVGRTFLGMTLGCARCHDHKFDPIPTTDYYALAGIFQSTQSMGEGSAASGVSSFATAKLEMLDTTQLDSLVRDLAALDIELAEIDTQLGGNMPIGSIDPKSVRGIIVDSPEARLTGHWKKSVHQGNWIGDDYLHDENKKKGESKIEFFAKLPETKNYEILVSYTSGAGRSNSTPVTVHNSNGSTLIELDQTEEPKILGAFVSIGSFPFTKNETAKITISNNGTTGYVVVDAIFFRSDEEPIGQERNIAELKTRRENLKSRRKSLTTKIKRLEPVTMAPSDSENPADGHVHIRGLARNKGAKVPRGFLTVASRPGFKPTIPDESSGRLELANWIANPDHPLTSRVIVNRVWQHLLGEGIVRTPDNFGKTGELPSHPELLDYLSIKFTKENWSLKKLVREIALSRTYQFSSKSTHDRDPENRLLSRANRKRLDAESIRDSILFISGELDPTRGGPTIQKVDQYDSNYQFNSVRRSVYVPWFRNSMLGILQVFDAPNPNLVTGRRSKTNLPTQALYLMNSPFIREQSQFTARRLLGSSRDQLPVREAYERILGRPPTHSEDASTRSYLEQFEAKDREEAMTQICQTLFSCLDFRFLD